MLSVLGNSVMTGDTFNQWFDSVRVYLDQEGHVENLSEQEQIWFYELYKSNWIPAYYAAKLFVESPVTYSA